MKKIIIFSAGDMDYTQRIDVGKGTVVVCADGGYKHAKNIGINPAVIIGDFDSIGEYDFDGEIIKFGAEKDDTDTMLAVKYALDNGYKNISIYGGLGGRTDHTMANMQALAYISVHGGEGVLHGINEKIYYLKESSGVFKKNDGEKSARYISLLAHSEVCEGVTLKGLKYPLNGAVVTNYFPLGASNEFINDECEITVKKGGAFIIINF